VAELLQKAANLGDADSAMSLMNLVMQFRKVRSRRLCLIHYIDAQQVCNHPELFERSDVVAPFSFCTFGRSGNLIREGDFLDCPYSAQNPIKFTIPNLFFLSSGLLGIPGEHARAGFEGHFFENLLSIWSTDFIFRSLNHSG
jgi:DNA helicase INO80